MYYAAFFRVLGFGLHKDNKSIHQYSRDFCDWLDKWTYYRTAAEIEGEYNKYFSNLTYIERFWLETRLEKYAGFIRWLPTPFIQALVNRFSGLVFTVKK